MAFADGIADFRSDTVTRPTPEMRRAMAEADVGDDVYGEDPTVNALEEEAAAAVGKPAAVFVPTGSMGNQLAIGVQTRPGDEALCVETGHVRNYEVAAAAAVSGVQFRTLPGPGGRMTPEEVGAAIDQSHYHMPRISMLIWENTHNVSGGTVVPYDLMVESTAVARNGGLSVHIDGARIFNAAIALDQPPSNLVAPADSVTFCLSKALGAPVGSVVCGEVDFIAQARRMRKLLGGGMRQAGVLAAAGMVALKEMVQRLEEDHENARRLAQGLTSTAGLVVDMAMVETNLVYIKVAHPNLTAPQLVERLATRGLLVLATSREFIRAVPTYHTSTKDIDTAVRIFRQCLGRD